MTPTVRLWSHFATSGFDNEFPVSLPCAKTQFSDAEIAVATQFYSVLLTALRDLFAVPGHGGWQRTEQH